MIAEMPEKRQVCRQAQALPRTQNAAAHRPPGSCAAAAFPVSFQLSEEPEAFSQAFSSAAFVSLFFMPAESSLIVRTMMITEMMKVSTSDVGME